MPAAPDPSDAADAGGRRLALIVATTRYSDDLRELRAPGRDAEDLGAVLADPALGGFEVTTVLDRASHEVRLAIEDVLADRRPGDLLLVYVSCHGLLDARRRLYFATTDTVKHRLGATGVEAQWLVELMEDCRARQQVLVLDCCFSGAFAQGAKGDDAADVDVGRRFTGQGRGRVVLTASRATEYSFEGEPVAGAAMPGSVFTAGLVAGIRSGAADLDGDGWVSVDDAYRYAFDHVRATDAQQTPQRWLYGAEGSILLARAPADGPRPAPVLPAPSVGAPTAPGPPVTGPDIGGRWTRRRIVVAAALALGAVAAVAAALVAFVDLPGGDDGVLTPSYGKDIQPTAPWRLVVRDDLGDNGEKDVGCVATLVDPATGEQIARTERIYGERSYQQHRVGRLRMELDHTGCTFVVRPGSGERELPFVQTSYTGDTDAFPAPDRVVVEAEDEDEDCDLTLRNAADGQDLDVATWQPGGGPVSLDPQDATSVYLAAVECTLQVSAG